MSHRDDIELQGLRAMDSLAGDHDEDAVSGGINVADDEGYELEMAPSLDAAEHMLDGEEADDVMGVTQFRDGFQTRTSPLGWMNSHRRAILALFVGLMLLLGGTAIFFLVHGGSGSNTGNSSQSTWESIDRVADQFAAGVSSTPIRENMRLFSSVAHLAGTAQDRQQAEQVRALLLEQYGLPEVEIEEFEVLLSYPVSASLAMVHPVRFDASLTEPPVPEDPTSASLSRAVPTFNGYSASGSVRDAQLVYVNYGRFEDYELLRARGVSLEGCVVLVRYGKGFRGNKAMLAEERGAVGVLIYSDPADDGYGKGTTYPQGGWRPEYGVQRGSVWTGNGDPLTPGWASVAGAPRLSIEEARDSTRMRGQPLPSIPIHPISWHDAQPLLRNLTGELPAADWQGGLPFTYHMGPGPTRVDFEVQQSYEVKTIWNVMGTIRGELEPDRLVLMGVHRDAWVAGAEDPVSGLVTFLEVARNLGQLVKGGWKPRRTIVLGNWDAEEYGLIGSVEWVEKHAAELNAGAVAYINVDMTTGGDRFLPRGCPNINGLMRTVTKQVEAPSVAYKGPTVFDSWTIDGSIDHRMQKLGSGSDFTAFLQFIGISCVDLRWEGEDRAEGIYHSIYDSNYWIENFGDPTWELLTSLTQVFGRLVINLAEAPVIPFRFNEYANDIHVYIEQLQILAEELDFTPMYEAASTFSKAAIELDSRADEMAANLDKYTALEVRQLSDRLMRVERSFINEYALKNRGLYKHYIFAPGRYDSYAGEAFPSLYDAIRADDMVEARYQIQLLAGLLNESAEFMATV